MSSGLLLDYIILQGKDLIKVLLNSGLSYINENGNV
jgi:hypothetical protein